MKRRDFLLATLGAALTTISRNAHAEQEPADGECHDGALEKVPAPAEYYRQHQYTPPELRRTGLFWGYKPTATPLPIYAGDTPDLFPYLAYELLSEAEKGMDSIFLAYKIPYCGHQPNSTNSVIRNKLTDPSFRYSKTKNYLDSIADLNKQYEGIPYEERVNNVILNLANSFRDVLYSAHTDWLGVPKTPLKLLGDSVGDCKDFALSRALCALSLGIKPEHVVVINWHAINANDPGHASLALYSPHRQAWLVVDGTGRMPDQSLGGAIIYENCQDNLDTFREGKGYMGKVVPYAAITAKGICGFDSYYGADLGYSKKSPQTMQPTLPGAIWQTLPVEPLLPAPTRSPYQPDMSFLNPYP